jgi:hypothetical protein
VNLPGADILMGALGVLLLLAVALTRCASCRERGACAACLESGEPRMPFFCPNWPFLQALRRARR